MLWLCWKRSLALQYERERRVDADHRAGRDQVRELCSQIARPAPEVENIEVRQDRELIEDMIVEGPMVSGMSQ